MKISRYRNFILGDPLLDFMNINFKKFGYKKDCDYASFDEDLLLDNYISKNKKKFINLIARDLGVDFNEYECSSGKVDLVIKTEKLKRYFKNGDVFGGTGYSVVTIEYCNLNINKKDEICDYPIQQKYYKYKNWMLKRECIANGINVDYSFILGRRYTNLDTYNHLFENKSEYNALKEEIDLHFNKLKNGSYVLGKNIFPNMKNKNDFPWHNAKKKISEKLKEITSIKGIGPKARDMYVKNGIKSYLKLYLPIVNNKEKLSSGDASIPSSKNNLFVDFEILTNVYDDFVKFPEANMDTVLFNIGCGYENSDNFLFNSYVAHALKDERKVVVEFIEFINSLEGGECTIFHWTHIEKYVLTKKLQQYSIEPNKEIKWFDLHDFFKENNIMIKGCYNYKLKNVARMLRKYKLIESKWDNTFSDGLGAMTGYIKYINTGDVEIMNDIAHYNMIDCKVLWEIWKLFKEIETD
jgi:hypothetical protein